MIKRLNWTDYLRMISDDAAGAAIARKTGIPASTISRWLSGEFDPKPRQVVEVARAYGASPIQALIAADFLRAEDLDLPESAPRQLQIRDFTELELAQEMVRRINEGESTSVLNDPLDSDHPAMSGLSPSANSNVSPIGKTSRRKTKVSNPESEMKRAALRDAEMDTPEQFD